jgi:hypothetical protein
VDVGNNGLTNNELARLGALYTGVLNGFIDASVGKRPVYVVFGDTDAETEQILAAHQQALVPDGLGFRVSTGPADRATTDPGFDLRGLTSEPAPLDEVAYSVIWMYPRALQQIGGYLSASGPSAADKALGARLLAQAQALAPFGANPQSRPHLR